jgi:hypothetical protein
MFRNFRIGAGLFGAILAALTCSTFAVADDHAKKAGTPEDDAYAARVWAYMLANGLVGEGRVRSFPFVGSRPHGSIQELIVTEAVIDGQRGRLIIKHNYGAEEALTPKNVYAASPDKNLEPLAIMFQREDGYDEENNNWFWAEYNADGSVFNYQGDNLSGRAPLCIGCHTPLGGKDREILNGSAQ